MSSCPESHVHARAALDDLNEAQEAALHAHVEQCDACAQLLDSMRAPVDAWSATRPHHAVPADLRATVLAAVAREAAGTSHVDARPATRSRQRRLRWPQIVVPALAACSLLLAIALIDARQHTSAIEGKLVRLESQVGDLEERPDLQVFNGATIEKLHTEGAFGGARGQVAINYDTGVVALRDIPEPPRGKVWQVWQVNEDDQIRSLGTISHARKARVFELNDVDEDSLQRIMITVEAGDGSTQPKADATVASHDFSDA